MEANNTSNEEKFYNFRAFVPVKFLKGNRSYYFGILNSEVTITSDTYVVVETVRGIELGITTANETSLENYHSNLGLKPIIRIATKADIKAHENNEKDATFAYEICENEISKLKLEMRLISAEYTLDRTKITFLYLSDDRVDFRELLKALASRLHVRIELRQIGSRDKSKIVGGIGVCGLPLCCSTFLNEFDGISISRAKNQMLAINIPKLSGQCGKLMCCLKYEDDTYTDLKKDFPDVGSHVWIDKNEYIVASINVISKMVTLKSVNETGDLLVLDLDNYNQQVYKRKDY